MTEPYHRIETRDGMIAEWDVPIRVRDGLVLRADAFRPMEGSKGPALLSYGPYAKGLPFQDGYPSAWNAMVIAARIRRQTRVARRLLPTSQEGRP